MYVLNNNLVFIAHPRMASRSIAKAMTEAGAEQPSPHHAMDLGIIEEIRGEGGTIFCVKRNMFEVLVSWFIRSRWPDFEEWLTAILRGGHEFLDNEIYHYGLEHCNWGIPIEDVSTVFKAFLRARGHHGIDLGYLGASNKDFYKEYYNPQSRRLVEDRWAKDLKITGYSYDN